MQGAHDVLDPHDGDAELAADAPEHLGRVVHLRWVEPAQALVGQQQGGPGGERARQLELLQPAGAEQRGGGVGIGGQAHQLEHLARPLARLGLGVALGRAVVGGHRHVLEDGELAERARDLEGAGDAPVADRVGGEAADLVAA